MSSSSSQETRDILLHHLKAFDSGDLDAILADYAEEAAVLTPDGILRGRDQIRPLFEFLLANVFAAESSFTMVQQLVEGEIAYIAWSAESEDYSVPLGTDTYLIRGGKIVIQTFAAKFIPKRP